MARTHATHDHTRDSCSEAKDQTGPATKSVDRAGLQAVGNQELQHLFAQGAVQAKLTISQPSDPDELEADRVAERVMSGGKAPPCACGGTCSSCSGEKTMLRRKTAEGGGGQAKAIQADAFGSGSGKPLDATTRAFFEPHFGDLGDVRIHTDDKAATTASAIGARAYTSGARIGFAANEFSPHASGGRRLLAHELAHVMQGGSLIRRQENEFGLTVLRPPGLPLDGGFKLIPVPEDQAGLFDDVAEGEFSEADVLLDDGGMADFEWQGPLQEGDMPSGYNPLLGGLEALGGGSASFLAMTSRYFSTYGFAAAGPDAVGLVMFPRLGSPGHLIPESRIAWGHTVMYVRRGGRITVLRSYGPRSLPGVVTSGMGAVERGTGSVAASIRSGSYAPGRGAPMWVQSGTRAIEWPVTPDAARIAAEAMPETGPVPGGSVPGTGRYTGVPSTRGGSCGVNCVAWATERVEGVLGGRFGPMGEGGVPTSIADLGEGRMPGGSPMQASQGRAYGWVSESGGPGTRSVIGYDTRTGARVVATLGEDGRMIVNALPEGATGAPVVSQMSRGMRVMRWGGRVFFVLGAAATVYEIADAEPDDMERTAVGAIANFGGGAAGGFLAGAATGLVCGPGAPVCSVLLGIGGAMLGGFLVREGAEAIYDATNPRHGGGRPATEADLIEFNAAWEQGDPCPNCHTTRRGSPNFDWSSGFSDDWNGDLGFGTGGSQLSNYAAQPGPPREVPLSAEEIAQIMAFIVPDTEAGAEEAPIYGPPAHRTKP